MPLHAQLITKCKSESFVSIPEFQNKSKLKLYYEEAREALIYGNLGLGFQFVPVQIIFNFDTYVKIIDLV